jgi:cytochrome c-type biogenesis protein CcmE
VTKLERIFNSSKRLQNYAVVLGSAQRRRHAPAVARETFPMRSQTIKILLSVLVITGAAGYLIADTLFATDALTYFHGADEVLEDPEAFKGRRIRLGGFVEEGSIGQKPGTLEYQFDVKPVAAMMKHPEMREKSLTVRYTGIVPDTFKDESEVIVTGVLRNDGIFEGQELIAKCPSKYEAEEKNAGTY